MQVRAQIYHKKSLIPVCKLQQVYRYVCFFVKFDPNGGLSGDKILLGSSQNGIKLILNFIIQYMIVCLYGLILLYSVLCTRLTHEIHHVIMAWHY